MSPEMTANRKCLISLIIGAAIGLISFLFWQIDQTVSLALLGIAMAIPIGVYLRFEDFIDIEDLLDERVATHEEEYAPEVEVPEGELSHLAIETIEGIGPTYGKMLREMGITTVSDLKNASPSSVKEACGVTTRQAERWIAMAQFAWLDSVSEEDAEAIVLATGIRELKKLANAKPEEILNRIQESVRNGEVEVPAGYEFTIEMVRAWIEEAKSKV